MNKAEQKVAPKVNKWMASVVKGSCPWEIKHTRGAQTFNIANVAQHQIDYLTAATTEHGFTYKIPDLGVTTPCDTIHYKNSQAYVVIVYPNSTHAIHIRDINSLIELKKMSLSEEKARLLAKYSV